MNSIQSIIADLEASFKIHDELNSGIPPNALAKRESVPIIRLSLADAKLLVNAAKETLPQGGHRCTYCLKSLPTQKGRDAHERYCNKIL